MAQVSFQFFDELNDFLPRRRRNAPFTHTFEHRAAIKDMIEALGVPHTEVDLVVVNGEPVDFGYVVRDGDDAQVFPISSGRSYPAAVRVGPAPLVEPRFVLDAHLGKLAAYLRLLGFDTLYRNDYDDQTLAHISSDEHRILLTRDRNLLKRSIVVYGYYVRETEARRQAVEVVHRFNLIEVIVPYQRCIRCNGLLRRVAKAAIAGRLAPKTREYYEDFQICMQCGQIYWKGSHYEPLQRFIDRVLTGD